MVLGSGLAGLIRPRRNRIVVRLADGLAARADEARDARRFRDAAVLYAEALRLVPERADLQVQCGHMFKEAGDLRSAERHYAEAARELPDDADLALQLGHFYKIAGRLHDARDAYQRAAVLRPHWSEPGFELTELARTGLATPETALLPEAQGDPVALFASVVPELLPGAAPEPRRTAHEAVVVRRFERRERSPWGLMPVLRGIEAVRGFCLSALPLDRVALSLDGRPVLTEALQGSPAAGPDGVGCKYVFNLWLDVSDWPAGRHDLELSLTGPDAATLVFRQTVAIAAPSEAARHADSDAAIVLGPVDPASLAAQINAQPSVVRTARRALMAGTPRRVLVLRTDQLGDLVASVPALRRLRVLLPQARLVGLLTAANADLARSLALFDEVIAIDFPDDPLERRRIMPLREQEELRERLRAQRFDLAIDLSPSPVSRPLLLLSGAPVLFGFSPAEFSWLSAGFEGVTRDALNGLERVPHSKRILGIVEWLGVLLNDQTVVAPRPETGRALLAPYGITATDRFVVFHAGARIVFSRWPHFAELARLVLQRTALKVVLIVDQPPEQTEQWAALAGSDRVVLVDKRLSFDELDAFASEAAVFVGNDSGPKHLASLRGTKVIGLHMARVNWSEWGQEHGGVVISRRVPCAGCSIHHEPEECGKDFACLVNISAEEVFAALQALL